MDKHKVYIEQTLHGYSNGHRLLETSSNLIDEDRKMMVVLSDLSGNEIINGFEKYYTGYRLPVSRKLVVACTWYAKNMPRPGCVWTHSLLFDENDLCNLCKNIEEIISLFTEPDDNRIYNYEESIILSESNEFEQILSETYLKYLIWCIWGNSSPTIIGVEDSLTYAKELIYLFLGQYKNLNKNFMFSTGSLAMRRFDSQIMDLQMVPKRLSFDKKYINDSVTKVVDQKDIKTYPVWVEKTLDNLKKDNLSQYYEFKKLISDRYCEAQYFTAIMKMYVGSGAETETFSLTSCLELVNALFDKEKKEISSRIIDAFFADNLNKWMLDKDYNNILLSFLEYDWVIVNDERYLYLIKEGISQDLAKARKCLMFITQITNDALKEKLQSFYAKEIGIDQFSGFSNMEYECCRVLIKYNPEFVVNQDIWFKSRDFQLGIIDCIDITKCDINLINRIVNKSLFVSKYNILDNLYEVFKGKCVKPMLYYYIDNKDTEKSQTIKKIAIQNITICLEVLKEKIEIKESHAILSLIEVIDPYRICDGEIESKDILNLVGVFEDRPKDEKQEDILARFILPLIFLKSIHLPINVVRFSYEIVNSRLAKQTLPEIEWSKLEERLPDISWLSKWDRCKRLRKGLKNRGYSMKDLGESEELDIHLL